jgi:hypothetical protein
MASFFLEDGFDEDHCRKVVQKIRDGIFRSFRSIQFSQKYKDLVIRYYANTIAHHLE